MKLLSPLFASLCAALLSGLSGCGTGIESDASSSNLTSNTAIFLEMTVDGTVICQATDNDADRIRCVEAQLLYMSGELNKTHHGDGAFGLAEVAIEQIEGMADELEEVRYVAKLPVAWSKYEPVPETYHVIVPRHADPDGLMAFNYGYKDICGHSKYGADYLWYDFRPVSTGCELESEDVLDTWATVVPSPAVTKQRRPEHERFWDDGVFRVVVVHGTHSSWAWDEEDALVKEYLELQDRITASHPEGTETALAGSASIFDHWQFEAEVTRYGGGPGKLVVHTLLAAPLDSVSPDFDERFAELSAQADLIMYGGHSGLSDNIKALLAKATITPQHYQVYFLNGCNTFAYLDPTIFDRRIEINGSELDPHGTQYLDVMANAQPASIVKVGVALWWVIELMGDEQPHGYREILRKLEGAAKPVVSGEEDNPSIED